MRSLTSPCPVKMLLATCTVISLVLISDNFCVGQKLLRAFPEAEGFGAFTPGGRGGDINFVTTLDDYIPGKEQHIPGSLRAAVDSEGPRYILFRVSGTIELKADLWIRKPFVTIAGQTAPGGGICIKDYQVVLATHDIVIRHLRFRSGDETRKEQMSIGIFGGHDSIIDHCSMSWAIDEVMSSFGTVHNLTVQWSIIAEGLSRSFHPKGEHSKGSILNGDGGVSIHHCIYAHNSARNPRVDTIILDFRNNIIYNWGYRAGYT
ncbi:MAG: pectate lyase family protein [Planctomycetota bacterium]